MVLPSFQMASWQTALQDLITDPAELLMLLELDPGLLGAAKKAADLFPLKVPRGFVSRMQKGNPLDPLLLQVLPIGLELDQVQGYEKDPLREVEFNPHPGLLHKYQGRVLVTLVGACAVHCRYCFRRHFPYKDNNPGTPGWDKIFQYLAEDESISEVILSGGDPLVASEKVLSLFTHQLALLPHIKRLRIHTRVPVVLPERITSELIQWLGSVKQQVVMVIHCNHSNEINVELKQALALLKAAGVTLLNQSVLLAGVNDNSQTLITLSETLFGAGVLPYYLHMADKVDSTAHFEVNLALAQKLHQVMSSQLPGYLVPRLVREIPGTPAKVSQT